MTLRSPVTWPILELFDAELGVPPPEPPEPAVTTAVAADALYMAGCDVFLTRDASDCFTLSLKYRGQVSEVKLTANVDEDGRPALVALVS
jgi:hypothetical protein